MKKVLIISYFFPSAGGGGVIRVAKFAKYLSFFGWQPIILTVNKGFYPIGDQSLLKEVSSKAEIQRVSYLEPGFWFRSRIWRSFLAYFLYPLIFLPDNQTLWLLPALWRAYRIIKKEKTKIVFTSASSYTDHLIALFLKKLTGVKWVADFRDTWTKSPYIKFSTPLHRTIARYLEKSFLKNADFVTTVSGGLTQSYRAILGYSPEKFATITNGFDKGDFNTKYKTLQKYKNYKKGTFVIVHVGSLYGSRKAEIFLKAFDELDLKNAKFVFVGDNERTSHRQAIEKMFMADILLLILSPFDGPEVLTGKIFEYLAVRKPILALAPLNSGAAKLIKELKVGEVCDPQNKEEIKEKLLKMYQKWLKNDLKIQEINLEKYKRKNLTKNLAKIFDSLIKKMKIKLCLIGNIQSAQNQGLCRYFVQKGYDIHFITVKPGKIQDVKTYLLASSDFTPWYFLKSLYRISGLINEIKPDIVHGQDLVFAGIWAYLSGFRPFVVTPWGSDVMNYDQFIKLEQKLIKKTLQKADLVTVSSDALKKQAEKIGLEKNTARMIHFGIDMNVFRRKTRGRKNIVFCPRAIGPIYNTDILIQAFATIAKKDTNIRLVLLENIADKKYMLEIKELINQYNLTHLIDFWPKAPNDKMADYYNQAEVIVSLSSSDGCSVSFLEAMACEKKIVATDLPYIKEWINGRNIWRVPVRNVDATAKAISEALEYPVLKWQNIGKLNRQMVAEKAEMENNFEKLNQLYQNLL